MFFSYIPYFQYILIWWNHVIHWINKICVVLHCVCNIQRRHQACHAHRTRPHSALRSSKDLRSHSVAVRAHTGDDHDQTTMLASHSPNRWKWYIPKSLMACDCGAFQRHTNGHIAKYYEMLGGYMLDDWRLARRFFPSWHTCAQVLDKIGGHNGANSLWPLTISRMPLPQSRGTWSAKMIYGNHFMYGFLVVGINACMYRTVIKHLVYLEFMNLSFYGEFTMQIVLSTTGETKNQTNNGYGNCWNLYSWSTHLGH